MAEAKKAKTATTKTTKTKTVPAKKPAKKPAGESVKPAKTTTKTVKTTADTSTKAAPKTSHHVWKTVVAVITAAVVVAVLVFVGAKIIANCADTNHSLETGKNEKLDAKYVSIDDLKYRILVPTNFKSLSAEEIAKEYTSDDAPDAVYSNSNSTVNIAMSKPEQTLSNDQIKTYLDTIKAVFDLSAKVISTDYYEVDGHNVGTIKLVTDFTDESIYNHMMFFSYDGKLALISFNCRDNMRDEWEKVGDEIIKSLEFTK